MELTSAGAHASIDPAAGGRIGSLAFAGQEVLLAHRAGDSPLLGGCYPMVPWAGRLRHGRLAFAGQVHQFPTVLAPPHAIHGTALTSAWSVDQHSTNWARLSFELRPPWPFGGRAVHHLRLTPTALILRLEVHAGGRPMPAACGWHPWFRRPLDDDTDGSGALLDLDASAMYRRDAEGLPDGALVDPPPGPWDDCFTGVTRWPRLTWPGVGSVTLRSSATHWVVYDEPADAICVEPQTGPPDGLNTAPHTISPGVPLIADLAIQWTPVRRRQEPASHL